MKLGRVLLASAVGVGASGLLARGQAATPPAPAAPQQAATQPAPADDAASLAQAVRQAPDPSAAVAAYAAATGRLGANPAVDDAYVRRMVEFNLPDLAETQAQNLVKYDPTNEVARAVVAYMQGRRGQAVDALATIVQATGGDRPVTDAFVLRTAGQLVAWYDTRADKGTIPEQLKSDVEATRQKLSAQDAYGQAYASARDAYQGKPATADVQPQQPLPPQPPVTTYEPPAPTVTAPATTYEPPPVVYSDPYSYPYGYTSYYYQPSYYWSPDYRWPRHHVYNPGYVPPVIIPRHHYGDWDHGHDGHDGRDWHDGDHGHDGHDGNHAPPAGPGGGGVGFSPRVHQYDDMRTTRNRDGTVTAERAIEPRSSDNDRPTPADPGRRGRAADAPAQPVPQPRSTADHGAGSPKADVAPRTERRIDPPAAQRPASPSPAPQQQPRSNDRSGSQQQQQQQSGGDRGKSR